MSVDILEGGLLSTLQDVGRPGHAALGVGRAGAMDLPAWRLANALVGNDAGEAALECTLRGPTLRFACAAIVALAGAPMPARIDNHALPMWTACRLPAGSVLTLGTAAAGCRTYLTVRGGFDMPAVLGSRSTDRHARLGHAGGRALQAGDRLPLGMRSALPAFRRACGLHALSWSLDPRPWFETARRPLLLLPGHHADKLDGASRATLEHGTFRIGSKSDRTASRLDGQTLRLRKPLELVSEPVLPGTLQLPPSGQPIVLLAEAPVTGGYPRIGQVAAVDLPLLTQRRPGDPVCFKPGSMDEACSRLAAWQQRLARLLGHIATRLDTPA